jgi:hypothetical protein
MYISVNTFGRQKTIGVKTYPWKHVLVYQMEPPFLWRRAFTLAVFSEAAILSQVTNPG